MSTTPDLPKGFHQPILDQIGANHARIRKTTGDSQAVVATRAGTTSPTISRIEAGDYPGLSTEMLVRLALGLRCPISDLLFGCDMALDMVRLQVGIDRPFQARTDDTPAAA